MNCISVCSRCDQNILQSVAMIDWSCYVCAHEDLFASCHNVHSSEPLQYHSFKRVHPWLCMCSPSSWRSQFGGCSYPLVYSEPGHLLVQAEGWPSCGSARCRCVWAVYPKDDEPTWTAWTQQTWASTNTVHRWLFSNSSVSMYMLQCHRWAITCQCLWKFTTVVLSLSSLAFHVTRSVCVRAQTNLSSPYPNSW